MSERSEQVAALLHEAGETRTTSRTGSSTATTRIGRSWYADWLVNLSELPQILGATPIRSELVWRLVGLESGAARTEVTPSL